MKNRIEFIKNNFNPIFKLYLYYTFVRTLIFMRTLLKKKQSYRSFKKQPCVFQTIIKVRTEFARKSFNFMAFRVPRIILSKVSSTHRKSQLASSQRVLSNIVIGQKFSQRACELAFAMSGKEP